MTKAMRGTIMPVLKEITKQLGSGAAELQLPMALFEQKRSSL